MRRINLFRLFGLTALWLAATVATAAQSPRVFVLNAKLLRERKSKLAEPSFKSALAAVERDARSALKAEIQPVVAKTALPPSGDKHDYMSQAPYFWPDPAKKDGLPYIRRDGERNPEIRKFPDHDMLDKLNVVVERLSIAYYFTGNEEYAARAAGFLRMWFLDPKTKMNPNLEYAQAVPGVNTGRGIGLIETRQLTKIIDGVGLLAGSKSWTADDQKGLEAWFAAFLKWMRESKNGLDESKSKNNHGTYYDVQIAAFALFTGQTELAKSTLEAVKKNRIASQIEPDGSQPLELARTKSWSYSTMNLEGFLELALLGDAAGVDLWSYQTSDGRGIRKSIEFLFPYATGEKKWTHQQIEEFVPERLFTLMRRASPHYADEKFKTMMASVPAAPPDSVFNLTGH